MPDKYHFKCGECENEFDAVAKRFSRCPNCGAGVHRAFTQTITPQKSKPIEPITPSFTSSLPKEDKETSSEDGSQPASISKSSEDSEKSPKSTKPSARLLRKGRMPVNRTATSKGIVKHNVAPKHTAPSITRKPEGSHQHKVEAMPEEDRYWKKMKKQYFHG